MDPLDQIPVNSVPTSAGQELFLLYRKGDVDTETYCNMNAMLAAGYANDMVPRKYFDLPEHLKTYVENRIVDRIAKDENLSKRLGEWLGSMISAIQKNTHDREHLLWALGRVREQNQKNEIQNLERALTRFDFLKYNQDLINKSALVLERDSKTSSKRVG